MDRDISEISKLAERIAKDPKSKLFVPLAEEYKKIGDIEKAIHVLTEGLNNNPGYVTARAILGKLLLENGDLDGSKKEFEEVIKAVPDNLLAQRKLGDIYALQGKPNEALARYKTLIVLSPKDQEALDLIADLEAGRDISEKLAKARSRPAAGPAPQPEQQKHTETPTAATPAASGRLPVTPQVAATASLKTGLEGMKEEEAEEVLIVEPLEMETGSGDATKKDDDLDFLVESGLDADAGKLPGLEVAMPGGYFEEEQPASSDQKPEHYTADDVLSPFGEEEVAAGGEALKKSDDFTTDTLAELYISQGFYEKAIDIYNRMLNENPGHQGLKDKLERLRALASESGGSEEKSQQAGAAVSPFKPADAQEEQGSVPDFLAEAGAADVPASWGADTEAANGGTFDFGAPSKPDFTAHEREAKEYVPPPSEPEEADQSAIFGGFDLNERVQTPEPSSEPGVSKEFVAPPAPEFFSEEPQHTGSAGKKAKLPQAGPAKSTTQSSSSSAAQKGKKEAINRLEHWLKNITKEQ